MRSIFYSIFTAALLIFSVLTNAQAETVNGKWESSRSDNATRYLIYSAPVSLLGKTTKFSVSFFCNAISSKTESGALGFDLYVNGVKKLSAFHFDDFEGPDAPAAAKKLMKVTITRKGKPPSSFTGAVNGGYPDVGNFSFNLADVSKDKTSLSKTILQALAEDAETLQLTVTDYRDAKVKLEFSIPLAGKQADFKTLLKDLK